MSNPADRKKTLHLPAKTVVKFRASMELKKAVAMLPADD